MFLRNRVCCRASFRATPCEQRLARGEEAAGRHVLVHLVGGARGDGEQPREELLLGDARLLGLARRGDRGGELAQLL